MHKTTLISIIGIVTVLFALAFSLYQLYSSEMEEFQEVCDENLSKAINGEFAARGSGNPINLKDPKIIVRKAADMTPEERASLKGDTITLNRAMRENLGSNMFEMLQQRLQDDMMQVTPLDIDNLDSLYQWYLRRAQVEAPFRLYIYNNVREIVQSTERELPSLLAHTWTEVKPIGTQGQMFVQAELAMPMSELVRNLFYAFLVLLFTSAVLIATFGRQSYVINRMREMLTVREDL